MKPPKYPTIEALSDAIDAEQENPEQMTMYLDGGEVIIRSSTSESDIYQGYEHEVLIELFMLCLGIGHEEI